MLRRWALASVCLLACGDDLAGSGARGGGGAGAQGGATGAGASAPAGTILWERPTWSSAAIGTDEQGNLYVSAPGTDDDFGPQPPTTPVDFDVHTVTKLDPSGQNVLYRKTFSVPRGFMSVGRDGSLVMTTVGTVTKLDPEGNAIWTSPVPPEGGPFVLSVDGRAWGPRDVFDTDGGVTEWRHPSGFIALREYDAGEHVVSVRVDNMSATYLLDAVNLDGTPLWSKNLPAPAPPSAVPRLSLRASGGKRTIIRQDIPQGDAGSSFDVGCGPHASALIVLSADGSCEWSVPLPAPVATYDPFPFSASNGAVVRSEDSIHLYDWGDGAEQWSFSGDPQSQLVPTANEGGAVYVLSIHGGLGGLARIQ